MNKAIKIEEIVHAVDKNFWVPAVGNGQIGNFVEFVLKNNLRAKFSNYRPSRHGNFAQYIDSVCRKADKSFWVPAVGNGQIGNFVRFCNRNRLWGQFEKVFKEGK